MSLQKFFRNLSMILQGDAAPKEKKRAMNLTGSK
jgi:hypothetical protein